MGAHWVSQQKRPLEPAITYPSATFTVVKHVPSRACPARLVLVTSSLALHTIRFGRSTPRFKSYY